MTRAKVLSKRGYRRAAQGILSSHDSYHLDFHQSGMFSGTKKSLWKMVKPKCRDKTILARARRLPAQEDSRADLYCRGPVRFQRNSTERAT